MIGWGWLKFHSLRFLFQRGELQLFFAKFCRHLGKSISLRCARQKLAKQNFQLLAVGGWLTWNLVFWWWVDLFSNALWDGVASEISWFAILGLSNRTPQASLRHDMSWPIPPTWCHEGEFQIMLVLYGFLKTGIDNRNIFDFVYMLMKDTELYHIQWFLWGLTSMYGTQSFPKFWYYPQFLGEKSAIIAREPKFDMILNWKKSAAKCAKFHEVGVTYWGNEFTIFLD